MQHSEISKMALNVSLENITSEWYNIQGLQRPSLPWVLVWLSAKYSIPKD